MSKANCNLKANLHSINLAEDDLCGCGEVQKQLLMRCPQYDVEKQSRFDYAHRLGIADINTTILLEGTGDVSKDTNKKIFFKVQNFILKTKRFS